MTNQPIIEIQDTSFGYTAGRRFIPVISQVSFVLQPGGFVVLEGQNGCGKSTILRALLKMGAQFQGKVAVRVARNDIGYVPQESGLDRSAPATAYDVVRSAFPFRRVERSQVMNALARVGLEHKEFVRYGSLSGGQRRRVLLARTLVHQARLIILDEPTANIDRETEREIESLLFKLIETSDVSVLATTHAAHWASKAQRISLLGGGADMGDFFLTFQFVLLPFVVMNTFSITLPAIGASLHIRNEILLAIALPPLASAALTLGVIIGIPSSSHVVLFLFTLLLVFSLVSVMGTLQISEINRQILLASLFVGGNVLTRLFMSVSPRAHAHLGFMLRGDMLALGTAELLQSIMLCIAVVAVLIVFRHALFSYCIDEELMRLRTSRFMWFSITDRLVATLAISASVMFIGPLLTSGLLIFPALFADLKKGGITYFFIAASVIGIIGSIAGFMAGIALDIPPAYSSSLGILLFGIMFKLGARLMLPK